MTKKTLTRGRAKSLRTRYPAKYAGKTREQMLALGLAKRGYVMPSGYVRRQIAKAA